MFFFSVVSDPSSVSINLSEVKERSFFSSIFFHFIAEVSIQCSLFPSMAVPRAPSAPPPLRCIKELSARMFFLRRASDRYLPFL